MLVRTVARRSRRGTGGRGPTAGRIWSASCTRRRGQGWPGCVLVLAVLQVETKNSTWPDRKPQFKKNQIATIMKGDLESTDRANQGWTNTKKSLRHLDGKGPGKPYLDVPVKGRLATAAGVVAPMAGQMCLFTRSSRRLLNLLALILIENSAREVAVCGCGERYDRDEVRERGSSHGGERETVGERVRSRFPTIIALIDLHMCAWHLSTRAEYCGSGRINYARDG